MSWQHLYLICMEFLPLNYSENFLSGVFKYNVTFVLDIFETWGHVVLSCVWVVSYLYLMSEFMFFCKILMKVSIFCCCKMLMLVVMIFFYDSINQDFLLFFYGKGVNWGSKNEILYIWKVCKILFYKICTCISFLFCELVVIKVFI